MTHDSKEAEHVMKKGGSEGAFSGKKVEHYFADGNSRAPK